jgi:putative tryptophan/tyrosine transport system substrate-binding protein
MRRRKFLILLGSATTSWPLTASAQQPAMPVVGFLSDASPDAYLDRVGAFRQGLREQGYVEGQNVAIEYRWANHQNDRLPELAADLVRRRVTVIAAIGGPAQALAAKRATATVPIVFQVGVDPIELGLIESLARPGGNITGVTSMNLDVASKRLELMHKVIPAATGMALLLNPTGAINAEGQYKDLQKAAQALGLQLDLVHASSERDFDMVFVTLDQQKVGGLVIGLDPLFSSNYAKLSALAIQHRLPAISPFREFPAVGGLMSYGGDIAESWRLAGVYTGRVLKGEKAADLPVQQSTKFELIINLKTAKALDITIPSMVLATADQVIE